jgi:hypothetical protein
MPTVSWKGCRVDYLIINPDRKLASQSQHGGETSRWSGIALSFRVNDHFATESNGSRSQVDGRTNESNTTG